MLGWSLGLGLLATIYIWLAFVRRPAVAIGWAAVLSLVFPVWCQWVLFEVPHGTVVGSGVDIKVGVGTIALILYSFFPKATFPTRLVACDYAFIAIICVHFLSDTINQGFDWTTLMRIYGEWYVPYLTGRLAIQNREDLQRLWPIVAGVSVGLGCASVFEACTGTNVWESIYGLRPEENTPRESARWGLRRAYGPCLNPIYFGSLQLILLAFSCFACRRATQRRARAIWLLAPVPAVLGIFCTGSRGPIVGLGFALLGWCFAAYPKLRGFLLTLLLVAVAVVFVQREQVITFLERWSGESERVAGGTVELGDKQVKFSGTRSRLILLDMYRIAFRRSGFVGFGTEAVTGFPVNVPLREQELETLRRLKWIDNSYALILLRFGYLGLAVFVLALASGLLQLLRISDSYRAQSPGILAAYMTGCLGAVLVVMLTVWMPHDFGFALLWSLGVASGLWVAHHYDALTPAVSPSRRPRQECETRKIPR